MTKKNELEEIAIKYRELTLQTKEIEKQTAPLKKRLTDYAKGLELDKLEIGGVTIEKRITEKASIDSGLVNPSWLKRLMSAGKYCLLEIGVKKDAMNDEKAIRLFDEVGFEVKESVTYAVRI